MIARLIRRIITPSCTEGTLDLLHVVQGTNNVNVWLSNLPSPLIASMLICSLSNTPNLGDCNHNNAVAVLDMREPFDNPMMCMMHGQAWRRSSMPQSTRIPMAHAGRFGSAWRVPMPRLRGFRFAMRGWASYRF